MIARSSSERVVFMLFAKKIQNINKDKARANLKLQIQNSKTI